MVVEMLKKRLGAEAIEKAWMEDHISYYFKIPSTLIIPEGCVRIGGAAFLDCNKLKKVEIPGSVKNIGYGAFWGCNGLEGAEILEGVERVGRSAFYQCRRLEKVEIPESVEVIRDWAFGDCTVAVVILKKPSINIGENAFYNCKSIEYVKEEIRS